MNLRVTHTFAVLPVSKETFNEIKRKLAEALYGHTFLDDGNTIDMHGIGLVIEPPKRIRKKK